MALQTDYIIVVGDLDGEDQSVPVTNERHT